MAARDAVSQTCLKAVHTFVFAIKRIANYHVWNSHRQHAARLLQPTPYDRLILSNSWASFISKRNCINIEWNLADVIRPAILADRLFDFAADVFSSCFLVSSFSPPNVGQSGSEVDNWWIVTKL